MPQTHRPPCAFLHSWFLPATGPLHCSSLCQGALPAHQLALHLTQLLLLSRLFKDTFLTLSAAGPTPQCPISSSISLSSLRQLSPPQLCHRFACSCLSSLHPGLNHAFQGNSSPIRFGQLCLPGPSPSCWDTAGAYSAAVVRMAECPTALFQA